MSEIGRELGIRSPVRLLESDHPSLLVTWGFVRPKVIIPRVARTWSDDRIAVVLRHELAHIRRGDWLVQIGGELLRAIYWFNPLDLDRLRPPARRRASGLRRRSPDERYRRARPTPRISLNWPDC